MKNTNLKLLCFHVSFISFSLLVASCSDLTLDPYEQASVTEFLDEIFAPIRFLLAIAGIALMLGGWKLYRFAVALLGFVLGAAIGFALGDTENDLFAIIGLIICGLIGAGLALLLHDFMVFVIGVLVGAVVAGGLWAVAADSFPPVLLLIIAGLIGASCYCFSQKPPSSFSLRR
jgi:hypothetical protein